MSNATAYNPTGAFDATSPPSLGTFNVGSAGRSSATFQESLVLCSTRSCECRTSSPRVTNSAGTSATSPVRCALPTSSPVKALLPSACTPPTSCSASARSPCAFTRSAASSCTPFRVRSPAAVSHRSARPSGRSSTELNTAITPVTSSSTMAIAKSPMRNGRLSAAVSLTGPPP